MMRHSPEDALGTNHELHILHKTDTADLLEAKVRESLNVLKPDFIYVHLSINDFMQNKRSSEITANYAEFSLRISDDLPKSRVILSLSTPTDRMTDIMRVKLSKFSINPPRIGSETQRDIKRRKKEGFTSTPTATFALKIGTRKKNYLFEMEST